MGLQKEATGAKEPATNPKIKTKNTVQQVVYSKMDIGHGTSREPCGQRILDTIVAYAIFFGSVSYTLMYYIKTN